MYYQIEISKGTKDTLEQLTNNASLSSDPCQLSGGLLLGNFFEGEASVIIEIKELVFAETHDFFEEFICSPQIWKDMYNVKSGGFPNYRILGWFIAGATLDKPGAKELDIHNRFFSETNKILFVATKQSMLAYYVKQEQFFSIPIRVIETKAEPRRDNLITEKKKDGLSVAVKKVILFTAMFFVCLFSIMYKDLTSPIDSRADKEATVQEQGATDASSSSLAKNSHNPSMENEEPTIEPEEKPKTKPEEKLEIMAEEKSNLKKNFSQQYYVVKKGDSLWSISEKYYGSGFKFYKIMKENKLVNPNNLHIGQRLIIPVD